MFAAATLIPIAYAADSYRTEAQERQEQREAAKREQREKAQAMKRERQERAEAKKREQREKAQADAAGLPDRARDFADFLRRARCDWRAVRSPARAPAHRRHERNERLHHTVGGKIDSKVGEVKAETTGAANAIDSAHERHEALEHTEGR